MSGPDFGRQFPGGADAQAFDRVAQRRAELRVVIDFAFQNQQRRGRALLAAVAERAVQHVFDRLVAIGERGDDRGILAAGFGEQVHRRLVARAFRRPCRCRR